MSKSYAISLKRSTALLAALTFMAMLSVVNLASIFGTVSAAQLSSRSLTLSSSLSGSETDGAAGSETNGSAAAHTFRFTTGAAGSTATAVRLQYCDAAVGNCVMPVGLVSTNATLGATNMTGTPALDDTVNGTLEISAAGIANSTATNVTISGITNPTGVGTFFVRILTAEDDTWADEVDEGTVTSAITEGISITTRVTETLGFSTTAEDSGVLAETPTCDALTGSGAIELGDPTEHTLSITESYDAYSAFRLYTNASNGVVVQYEGATLTKGSDEIDEIGASAAFVNFGTEQFGLGVDTTGGDITNADDGTWTTNTPGELELGAAYGLAAGSIAVEGAGAQFAFVADAPTTLAASDVAFGGYVNCATGAVRYVANVSPLTPSGTYTTTIVYSAVPTY